MGDILKPITFDTGSHGEVTCYIEGIVKKIRQAIYDSMRQVYSAPPQCIRCKEEPGVMPKTIILRISGSGSTVELAPYKHESAQGSKMVYDTSGWKMFAGDREGLCPECHEFISTVGKDGGA